MKDIIMQAGKYALPLAISVVTLIGSKDNQKNLKTELLNEPLFATAAASTLRTPPITRISDAKIPEAKVLMIKDGKFIKEPYHDNPFAQGYEHTIAQVEETLRLLPEIAELVARRDLDQPEKGYRLRKTNLEATLAGLIRQESILTQSNITPKGDTVLVTSSMGYGGVGQLGKDAITDVHTFHQDRKRQLSLEDSLSDYHKEGNLIDWMLRNEQDKAFDTDLEGLKDNLIKAAQYFTMQYRRFGNENLAHTAYNGSTSRAAQIKKQLPKGQSTKHTTYEQIKEHLATETQNYIPLVDQYKTAYRKDKEAFAKDAMGDALNRYVIGPMREAFQEADDKERAAEQLSTFHHYLIEREANKLIGEHYVSNNIAKSMIEVGEYYLTAGDQEKAKESFEHVQELIPHDRFLAKRAGHLLRELQDTYTQVPLDAATIHAMADTQPR